MPASLPTQTLIWGRARVHLLYDFPLRACLETAITPTAPASEHLIFPHPLSPPGPGDFRRWSGLYPILQKETKGKKWDDDFLM